MWNTGVYLLAHLYYNLQSSRTVLFHVANDNNKKKREKKKIPVTQTPWRKKNNYYNTDDGNFKAEVGLHTRLLSLKN